MSTARSGAPRTTVPDGRRCPILLRNPTANPQPGPGTQYSKHVMGFRSQWRVPVQSWGPCPVPGFGPVLGFGASHGHCGAPANRGQFDDVPDRTWACRGVPSRTSDRIAQNALSRRDLDAYSHSCRRRRSSRVRAGGLWRHRYRHTRRSGTHSGHHTSHRHPSHTSHGHPNHTSHRRRNCPGRTGHRRCGRPGLCPFLWHGRRPRGLRADGRRRRADRQ